MVPQIETEIRVFPAGDGKFSWSVRVSSDNPADQAMVVAGQATGYLTARFRALECCKQLSRAALQPVLDSTRLQLKGKNPSDANLSRGRTA